MLKKEKINIKINGTDYKFSVGDGFGEVLPSETLAFTLRERMQLTGTKISCDGGACGCCTVLLNDEAVPACMLLTVDCDGKSVVTVEGLEDPEKGLDPIQQAFIDEYAFQCGYCTPGIIMAAKGLFIANPHPTAAEIGEALSGNFCRCISHYTVLRALNKLAGNEDELVDMVRAADLIEDPIPIRQEIYPSPYANGTRSPHALD